jgi:transposase
MAPKRDHAEMKDRRLAAVAHFEQGTGDTEIARLLGVSRQAVHGWRRDWKSGGSAALRRSVPPGAKPKLTPEKKRVLIVGALEGDPRAKRFRGNAWTLPGLVAYIEDATGQKYAPASVARILHHQGYECQGRPSRAHGRGGSVKDHWRKMK